MNKPTIDRDRFTVSYGGKSCFLGNTMLFRLMERLAHSPGIYIPHHTIAEDVWGDEGTDSRSIHKQASLLRLQLCAAGIDTIVIDGKTRGHYRLILR